VSSATRVALRCYSSAAAQSNESYRFVVAGGGAGGLAIASSLARKYGEGSVAVIEPSEVWSLGSDLYSHSNKGFNF